MNYTQNQYNISEEEIKIEFEIIEKSKKDINSFSVLYDKYYIKIFRFIFNRVETVEIAADLTSQVFLKAINSLKTYENRTLPYASFLYRIARNEINLESRKNKIEIVLNAKTSDLESIADEIDENKEENYLKLYELLNTLNKNELELIGMKYFEKRSYKEISEILNENETNLKVKVHRIIQKLKNRLNS